ncbi:MAG: hypothetical protein Q9220_000833 [cf. Caloplaca sp. 1 TL-2023]
MALHSAPYAIRAAEKIATQFEFSDDEIRKCVQRFLQQMEEGLRERTPSMCQIPTYVTRIANGKEKGLAFGVDLGGTNLRVCLVDLHGDASYDAVYGKTRVPSELMVNGEAANLFAFITDQIEMLLKTHRPDYLGEANPMNTFSLGLTFSFPVYQNAIDSGILLRWTKGFDIPSVVGEDVCQLLQHQIDLRNLPIRVTALVNDAAGTVMSRAYSLPLNQKRTSIGTIFGTGTNGVYLEKLSNIGKPLDGYFDSSTGKMLISIEWGSFDNDLLVLPNTDFDMEVDQASINPRNQVFEKRVSGMFLGELLRTILAKMHSDPSVGLFQNFDRGAGLEGKHEIPLYTHWAVDASILSCAEDDNSEDLLVLRQKIVATLGIPTSVVGVEDARVVKIIAHAIGTRAARLGGMALGAVILKTEQLDQPKSSAQSKHAAIPLGQGQIEVENIVTLPTGMDIGNERDSSLTPDESCLVDVGVDGSVIEFYPGFEAYMREALRAVEGIGLAGEGKIRIGLTKDGSSIGAAIIALISAQQAHTISSI